MVQSRTPLGELLSVGVRVGILGFLLLITVHKVTRVALRVLGLVALARLGSSLGSGLGDDVPDLSESVSAGGSDGGGCSGGGDSPVRKGRRG